MRTGDLLEPGARDCPDAVRRGPHRDQGIGAHALREGGHRREEGIGRSIVEALLAGLGRDVVARAGVTDAEEMNAQPDLARG